MTHTTIQIDTQDGVCPAHLFQPDGDGPWPGVLFYMDGIGIRPALFDMGERMASAGYFVMLPDLFYRIGPTSFDAKTLFTDPVSREYFMKQVRPTASIANIMRDTSAFLAHLEAQPAVRTGAIGVTATAWAASCPSPPRVTSPSALRPRRRIIRADSRPTRRTARTCWRRGSARACTWVARCRIRGSTMRRRSGWSGRSRTLAWSTRSRRTMRDMGGCQ